MRRSGGRPGGRSVDSGWRLTSELKSERESGHGQGAGACEQQRELGLPVMGREIKFQNSKNKKNPKGLEATSKSRTHNRLKQGGGNRPRR